MDSETICHYCGEKLPHEKCSEVKKPDPGELKFDPEDPMCPVCHESLRLMDGCEWSDNPIENSCRECLFDYIDRLTAENKAKDEKARLFHLEVQEAIEALIGCEDDKSLKGESK